MRYYLSPSLMCMDMMKLTEQLRFLNSKADRLHVDIMDGHYVKIWRCRPALWRRSVPTPRFLSMSI
nr:D-allulose-6-phosphate 3-epimerase [Klebsiella pneumoniae]